jgi:hypothetical protein
VTEQSAGDFVLVASFLTVDETTELAAISQQWVDCEDARARSAVSRAYYAAFRVLKSRLLDQRVEWRRDVRNFPRRKIHQLMHAALQTSLGEKHPLVRSFKSLLFRRNQCDYMFEPKCTGDDADGDVASAMDAIEEIRKLSDEELAGIALELHNLDVALTGE